jgi:pimeloyl-ACP methyl ester carboxylesterase
MKNVILAVFLLASSLPAGEDLRLSYRSPIDDTEQPYRLYVPTAYDGKTPLPLVIALHGTGGTEATLFEKYGDGAIKLAAEKHGMLLVSPLARGMTEFYGIGEHDVLCVLADVRSRYRVDPDRIYITGHSMGGTGSARIALQHPDVFAAAAPLASAFSHPHLAPNAAHVPFWWIMGGEDDPYYFKGVLPGVARMIFPGRPHRLSVLPGRDHRDWVPEYFDPVFAWLLKHRRVAQPRHYVFAALTPMHGRAYSSAIDRIARPGTVGTLEVRIEEKNLVRVQTANVSAFAVLPEPGSVRLTVDGTAAFEGTVTEAQEVRCTLDASGWKAGTAERRKRDVPAWRANPVATSERELRMEGIEAPLADWITDAMRRATGADIALYNRVHYRGLPLPMGTVDMVDLIQASRPFEQMLVTVQLSGKDLLEILDANVLEPGDKAKLNTLVQISGARYVFDSHRPKGSRIVSSDLERDRLYKVVLEGHVPERQTLKLAGRFGTLPCTTTEIPFAGALYAHATATGRIVVETEGRVRETSSDPK